MTITKKMTIQKTVSLLTLSNALGNTDILIATAASKFGPYVKLDLPSVPNTSGGITTTKFPFLLIPIADLQAQFPTIFAALGPSGITGAFIVASDITFEGDSDQTFV